MQKYVIGAKSMAEFFIGAVKAGEIREKKFLASEQDGLSLEALYPVSNCRFLTV